MWQVIWVSVKCMIVHCNISSGQDITLFIKTCHTCQLTGKHNQVIKPAPLYPIPAIGQVSSSQYSVSLKYYNLTKVPTSHPISLRRCFKELLGDWEDGLPWLLLAAREVVQESTGFNLKDLVFGHEVCGPLAVLQEGYLPEPISKPHRLCEQVQIKTGR